MRQKIIVCVALLCSTMVSYGQTDTLRLSLYNTIYLEHGEQFYNEVSPAFRWTFATNWSVGAGMTFG